MYILDTNVVSEIRKATGGKADGNVVRWLSRLDAASCCLSVVTLLELEFGILRIERRDPDQYRTLRNWIDQRVMPEFSGRILPIDTAVALQCARLHVPDPRPERDAMIAATALVHGMTLVTRNVADFASMGVRLTNPWAPEAHSEASARSIRSPRT